MKLKLLLVLVLFTLGCAQARLRPVSDHERTLYEHGVRALSKEEYAQAQEYFLKLLQEFPTTRWLASAYFNLGRALEGQKKYSEAIEQYKKAIDYYQGVHSKEESEALYRMSICYEALGEDQKTVLVLLQLKEGLRFLERSVVEAEWPSRLAGAYARQNMLEQAKSYYDQAQAGLKYLQRGGGSDFERWLPKTYFSMGHTPEARLNFKSKNGVEGFLMSFENSQIWLLKAAQMKVPPWSEMAADEIVQVYTKIWNAIDHLSVDESKDPLLATKKKQEDQKALATRLDSLLYNLNIEKSPILPGQKGDVKLAEVFSYLKGLQKRVDLLMSQRDVQDQPTAELKARQNYRTRGKK